MALRELLEQAEADIERFRHPDIDEAQTRLNAVLEASGLGSTGNDEITFMLVGKDTVSVGTRYSVRSCEQHGSFELPISIVDAPDPVAFGKLWGLRERRNKAENEVASAQRTLDYKKAALEKAEAELLAAHAING